VVTDASARRVIIVCVTGAACSGNTNVVSYDADSGNLLGSSKTNPGLLFK